MSLDTDGDQILANAHRPPDPDLQAAAAKWVVSHGGADCLTMLGLDGAA